MVKRSCFASARFSRTLHCMIIRTASTVLLNMRIVPADMSHHIRPCGFFFFPPYFCFPHVSSNAFTGESVVRTQKLFIASHRLSYNIETRIAVPPLYSHDACRCIQCFVFSMTESSRDAVQDVQDCHTRCRILGGH